MNIPIPGSGLCFTVTDPKLQTPEMREWLVACAAKLARQLAKRRPAQPGPKKRALPSVEHHAKERRAEVRNEEHVKSDVWQVVLSRTMVDHGIVHACEACHARPLDGWRGLKPHHLEMGAGGRRDAPEAVMALCPGCHRLDPKSAHRSPRHFAQTIVIPWAKAHGYPLPNRKEYR